ncbi:MAG: 4Fe-4S dicluster domain-containing protein [Deltaproteobacteria bacterium]|nr:4Fe-4S dicluster domain-containing protein [Deltaproteobacteria bacterium]
MGLAAVGLTGWESSAHLSGLGNWAPPGLLRPPGALPEPSFLSQCVRCGECMAVCPRNALQPVWLEAGWLGLFSPALVPRRGYCDPDCNLCGQVCPVGAIRALVLTERRWARPGLAAINRSTCLAWEHQKRCMVCGEVCPFKAIHFEKPAGGQVAAPYVLEERCAGRGSCEHYCPVGNRAAITVVPMGALRLERGSFIDHGQSLGLKISLKEASQSQKKVQSGPAPGFTD